MVEKNLMFSKTNDVGHFFTFYLHKNNFDEAACFFISI